MEDFARQQIEKFKLPSGGASPREKKQGFWDIPAELEKLTSTDIPTNKKLFAAFPDWCLLTAFNSLHVWVDAKGEKQTGVWTIFEANPRKTPREYYPCFPLMFKTMDDGETWVDRKEGIPAHPQECWNLIKKTLDFKNIGNKQRFGSPEDVLKEADAAHEDLKKSNVEKIRQLDQDFINEEFGVTGDSKKKVHLNQDANNDGKSEPIIIVAE